MEKKQVSTFLKILQIPSNASPEEIKKSLLVSGWNENDALEAITVLYPEYKSDQESIEVKQTSQIVAQKYVKQEDQLVHTFAQSPEKIQHVGSESSPATPQVEETLNAAETAESVLPDAPPADSKVPIPENLDLEAERVRPHTDAPWLQHSVDIYDITEEEKQEMIRTVYRTNEKLSPQTIHALLGIDVDLSEYEASYRDKRQSEDFDVFHLLVILLASLAIASSALFFGMYYFEVGPFHPTVVNDRT